MRSNLCDTCLYRMVCRKWRVWRLLGDCVRECEEYEYLAPPDYLPFPWPWWGRECKKEEE